MKALYITFFLLLFFLFSCKKTETNSESNIQSALANPSSLPKYDAFFICEAHATVTNSISASVPYTLRAYIMSVPSPSFNLDLGINSGTISVNGISLKYIVGQYEDTTQQINLLTSRNFQLQSNGSIPSFSFNNTDTFPNFYFNYNSLINDTLSKAAGYTIPLSSFIYPDEIMCELDGPNSSFLVKTVPKGTQQVVLSAPELSMFPVGTNLTLFITLRKFNVKNIGSKSLRFENNTYTSFSVHVNS